MNFQFWDLAAASAMFNTTQSQGSAHANVSPYGRRPSKIVKPQSNSGSPRALGRRRLTTSGQFPARTRSVVDYQRPVMPCQSQYRCPPHRPISWHSNSSPQIYQPPQPRQQPPSLTYPSQNLDYSPYSTTQVHGLVTPMSYPVVNEPYIHELITPLEELSAEDAYSQYEGNYRQPVGDFWQGQQQQRQPKIPRYHQYDDRHQHMHYPMLYNFARQQSASMPTAPASPNTLATDEMIVSSTADSTETERNKDELVGMGLYDSPADIQSSSLLLGCNSNNGRRKSLKLEDEFEPSPISEDTDDQDDADAEPDDVSPAPSGRDSAKTPSAIVEMACEIPTSLIDGADYSSMLESSFMPANWQSQSGANYGWI